MRAEKDESSGWTVEQAAWLATGLLAAGLRFFRLGLRPLSEGEAVQALAAVRFTQGAGPMAPAGTLPALFTGNLAWFSLFGADDFSARLLPALAGVILVLLPYWLRHRIGRHGALAAAFLLAISPSAIFFSRTVDGAMLVAACGLALAVGIVQFLDAPRPGPLYTAAAALGLGLCAGPGIYSILLIFAAFGLLLYLSRGSPAEGVRRDQQVAAAGWQALAAGWRALRGERAMLGRAGITLATTFGLAATALVLHPAGMGDAADLLAAWARGFLPVPGEQPFYYPLLLLLRYEPLILLLGLVEAAWAVFKRRGDPKWREVPAEGSPADQVEHPRPGPGTPQGAKAATRPHAAAVPMAATFPHSAFLAFWAAAATVIVVTAGQRPAGNILLVVVPLALLAGQGIERAGRWMAGHIPLWGMWPSAVLAALAALGLLVFFYLQVTAYVQAGPSIGIKIWEVALLNTTSYLLLAGVAVLLLVALGVGLWIWRGPELVVAGGWLAAVIALGLFGFKAAWTLNFSHATDARELMVLEATAPDVRDMVTELERLSLDQAGDAHTLAITTDADTGPVVAWYLRQFEKQTVVEGLSSPPDTLAAVTLAMEEPPIGQTFRGQGFPLRTQSDPWSLWGQDLVRWLLFTGGDPPVMEQEVVLWVASTGDRLGPSGQPVAP